MLLASLLTLGSVHGASTTTVAEPLNRPAPSVAQPQRALLNGIVRAGQRLVAVGEHGLVIWSDDNGQAWHQATVPVDVNLTAVAFADERHGWAIGHQGVVLSSEDGGEHWRKRLDGVQAAALTLAQAELHARALDESAREELLYTAQRLVDDGPDKPFLALLLDGPDRVSVVGAFNLALRTQDGGKTWQAFSEQVENAEGLHLYALQAQGAKRFLAGEQGLLLATDTADGPFKRLASPYEGSYFGLLPLANNRLLLFGLRANAFRSDDGGQQWQAVTLNGAKASFNAGLQLSDGSIVLLDQGGRVYISQDQGRSFQPVAFGWGTPLTAAAQASDGSLVLTSLAGIVTLPAEKLAGPLSIAQEPTP
ncbi:bnr domain-containing protein [Pseudomonas ogarae]|nr:bnr domain-containing protein [Pseudomonas ogarae]